MSQPTPRLQVTDLAVTYPTNHTRDPQLTEAISGVSLSLGTEILSLTGPSGCGKSSLLNSLAGIIQPAAGSILLDGTPLSPRRHQIALVPQQYGLLPWKTVRENIALPERLGKRCVPDDLRQTILETLGLTTLLGRYPSQLSGGQRQRVALARALTMQSDLLLLDEAFSALDVATAMRSRELFRHLWSLRPVPTICVTHSPDEALALSERIQLIGGRPGRLIRELHRPSREELITQLQLLDEDL